MSRNFYTTMATLAGRIKLHAVARHHNDKISASPSMIPESSKRRRRDGFRLRSSDTAQLCRSLQIAPVDYVGFCGDAC